MNIRTSYSIFLPRQKQLHYYYCIQRLLMYLHIPNSIVMSLLILYYEPSFASCFIKNNVLRQVEEEDASWVELERREHHMDNLQYVYDLKLFLCPPDGRSMQQEKMLLLILIKIRQERAHLPLAFDPFPVCLLHLLLSVLLDCIEFISFPQFLLIHLLNLAPLPPWTPSFCWGPSFLQCDNEGVDIPILNDVHCFMGRAVVGVCSAEESAGRRR